jgi:hypothetical protein
MGAGLCGGAGVAGAQTGATPGALRVFAVDGVGRLSPPATWRASMQRLPPAEVPVDPVMAHGDPDALRYLFAGRADQLPSVIDIDGISEPGARTGALSSLALQGVACPDGVRGPSCAVTAPIRVVADEIDGQHPLVRSRSIEGRLGGRLALRHHGGPTIARVPIDGPRQSPIGAIDRHRAQVRFTMVRLAPGGSPPVGGDDDGSRRVARAALERINGMWGSCGISFGPSAQLEVRIVDPPPAHLLAVGCGHGLPASGGRLRFRVDGKPISVPIDRGMRPRAAARRVAARLRERGWVVVLSDNPRITAAAGRSTDLSLRRRDGSLASLSLPQRGPLSSDASLTTCIGSVNLEDGLHHFSDVDASTGTLEERTLLKGLDLGDPSVIHVVVVPGFAAGGRIGESFIGTDGGSIRNVVLVDRAAVRANRTSFTIAHELGHVLLDDPGHPDDYGIDLPWRLMDADAADPSAFGPRRLSLDECARALRQSGAKAPLPLLKAWPVKR